MSSHHKDNYQHTHTYKHFRPLKPPFKVKPLPRYSVERINFLAQPKDRNPYFMPDRPSPYFLDYLIDPRPLKIRSAQELMAYYQQFHSRLPRLEALSRPKTPYTPTSNLRRPQTCSECACLRIPFFSKHTLSPVSPDEGGDRRVGDDVNNNRSGCDVNNSFPRYGKSTMVGMTVTRSPCKSPYIKNYEKKGSAYSLARSTSKSKRKLGESLK